MKDLRFAKFVLAVNGLVPGGLLLWDAYHGNAGANPVNYAIRTTGLLALIFLPLSLLITPLRKITGLSWLFHFRRLLGLFAFFYALAHFAIFFVFDRALSVRDTLTEMVKRPYLVVGSLGLLAMVPLAATSANFMIKRLGPNRWRALHRLAYVAVVAGVVHFYMLVKSDVRMPVAFGIIVAVLLGYRLLAFIARRLKAPATLLSKSPAETPRWAGQLLVERITQETADVRTFRLVSPDGGALPFAYLPGQYLTLALPIAGKTVRRSYTIASTPTSTGHCEVTIKRDKNGLVSRHMHDAVKEGHLLSASAPGGQFTFNGEKAKSIALLAAGVGITPLMSILRYLTDQNWGGQIYLVYSNKEEHDIIFRNEIELMKRRFPNLHVALTLTRADGSNWDGGRGRIDAALLEQAIPDVAATPFYLCGPAEMLKATRELLGRMGVAEANIHLESFGTPAATIYPGSASNEEFKVTFARSKREATIDGRRLILTLAEELGIEVDSECRSGICGRCKCQLISGSVTMENQEALDMTDRQRNVILLCQARAVQDVTLMA